MNLQEEKFLTSRHIAFFGVSRSERKMGNTIFRAMKRHGYTLYPIHPTLEELDGIPCYTRLQDISAPIDAVLINVSPENSLSIIEAANNLGIQKFWLQQGAESQAAISFGKVNQLIIITGQCILMRL